MPSPRAHPSLSSTPLTERSIIIVDPFPSFIIIIPELPYTGYDGDDGLPLPHPPPIGFIAPIMDAPLAKDGK